MFPLLVSAALAASPVERLRAAAQDSPGDAMGLSCTPVGPLFEVIRSTSDSALAKRDPQLVSWVQALPEDLAQTGLDPTGDLDMFANEQTGDGAIHLDFAGTPEQAEALLTQIFPDSLVIEPDGWSAATQKDSWRILLDQGRLSFLTQSTPTPSHDRPPLTELLAPLPETDGCALLMASTDPEGKPFALAGYFGDHQARLRVHLDQPQLAVLAGDGAAPQAASSTVQPTAVISLGVPLLQLLTNPATPQQARELASDIAEHATIPGGATAALFVDDQAKDLVVVVPVQDTHGHDVPARRLFKALQRGLPEQGVPFEKTGRNAFSTQFKDREIFAITHKGRLVIGTQAQRVSESASGEGSPWLSAEDVQWATEWPTSVFFPDAGRTLGFEDLDARLGLHIEAPMVDLGFQLSGTVPDTTAVLEALSALSQGDATQQLRQLLHDIPAP